LSEEYGQLLHRGIGGGMYTRKGVKFCPRAGCGKGLGSTHANDGCKAFLNHCSDRAQQEQKICRKKRLQGRI
jgi:hypothetical protein